MKKRLLYFIGILAVIVAGFVLVQLALPDSFQGKSQSGGTRQGQSSDVLHIDYTVSPRTVARFPYAAVVVRVANYGQPSDVLILKKIEIIGREERLLLSLTPHTTLLPIGQEVSRFQEIDKQIKSLSGRMHSLSANEQAELSNLGDEGRRLLMHTRDNTFLYENREKGVDLRNTKEDPLLPGDRVPLTLRITADLNGVNVTRNVVEYVEINP